MVHARKYVVKKQFQGLPKRDDFEIVEHELPPVKNGEILVKVEWVSVDPYLFVFNARVPIPYDQFGYQIGLVEDSKDPRYPVGTRVVSHKGWCDYCVIDTTETGLSGVYKLPNLTGLSDSLGLSAVGVIGSIAYFGLLDICKPKAGETVVVTGASGGIGSLVGQIAKIKGCKVIGFAGSDDKVKLLEEIGFDKVINYKTANIAAALKEAAPDGVDCYFDNAGGEISSHIINQMNEYGRVAVCGSISADQEDPMNLPKATILQPAIIFKQLKIEGFRGDRWASRYTEAFSNMTKWIQSGQLKPTEHITEGFDKIYDAFIEMLKGEKFGKSVVKI